MRIGIAAPIEVSSLKAHFNKLSSFDMSLGIGGTAVNIIIDGFLKLGHKVTVFTLDVKVKDKYVLEGEHLKIVFGHFRASSRFKTFDFCYQEFKQVKQFINEEQENLDVINAHWSYEFAIGALLANLNKTVVTFRDDAPSILKILKHPYRVTRLLMDAWVRKKAIWKTYNSVYLEKLIRLEGTVIGNPIFYENFTSPREYPIEKKTFKICFIANGTDFRKNPHVAIKAFQILKRKHKHVALFFIGKGYGINEEFALQYQYLEQLNDFDLMVHTALEESFGNNLIEAMAKGIPVVAGKNSGAVPWVLNFGQAGVLVDITTPELISKAIEKLIEHPSEYTKFSEMGYQNVVDRFTQKSVCGQYIQVYENIIKG
jgi:glycosyltransferase involved in cell wall biosynthesis